MHTDNSGELPPMNGAILVSVLVPAYNAESTIQETLDSVLNQTHRPIELVVLDDGSDDSSRSILAEAEAPMREAGIRFRVISQSNAGLVPSRRRLLGEASGALVQLLDADDLLHPEKLSIAVASWERSRWSVFVARTRKFRDSSEVRESLAACAFNTSPWTRLERMQPLMHGWWHSVGPVFDRRFLLTLDPFDRDVPGYQEELLAHGRVKLAEAPTVFDERVLSYYRKGRASLTNSGLDVIHRNRVESTYLALSLLAENPQPVGRSVFQMTSIAWFSLRTYVQIVRAKSLRFEPRARGALVKALRELARSLLARRRRGSRSPAS